MHEQEMAEWLDGLFLCSRMNRSASCHQMSVSSPVPAVFQEPQSTLSPYHRSYFHLHGHSRDKVLWVALLQMVSSDCFKVTQQMDPARPASPSCGALALLRTPV